MWIFQSDKEGVEGFCVYLQLFSSDTIVVE